MSEVKTKLSFGGAIDSVVAALEGFDSKTRGAILDAVCNHLGVDSAATDRHSSSNLQAPAHAPSAPAGVSTVASLPKHATRSGESQIDIRQLRTEKKPSSARQMACVVAYYLQEHAPESEQKQTVTAADLEKYFKQAGFPLPKKIEQVLPDAKIGGYFEATSARGAYKLTRVGYNLVVQKLPTKASE